MHMAMGTVSIFTKNDSAAASSDEPSSRDIQEAHEHGLEIVKKPAYLYTLFSESCTVASQGLDPWGF